MYKIFFTCCNTDVKYVTLFFCRETRSIFKEMRGYLGYVLLYMYYKLTSKYIIKIKENEQRGTERLKAKVV